MKHPTLIAWGVMLAGLLPCDGSPSARAAPPSTTMPSDVAVAGGGEEKRGGELSCAHLEDLTDSAVAPLDQAGAGIAAAQCILVIRCAPPLSAKCCGAASKEDAEELALNAERALALLDRASAALAQAGDEPGLDTIRGLEDRIDLLRALGEVFLALSAAPESPNAERRLIRACNGLAVYLDEENPKIVESAKLWLGAAYHAAGRPDRALLVLRPSLTEPADPRIGFMGRLLRARALGDRGDYVAGLALCSRLSARAKVWFAAEGPAAQEEARDAVRYTRVELLRAWAQGLRSAGQAERADAAAAEAKRLIGSDPHPSKHRGLRLVETIAGLDNPNAEERPERNQEAPASAPAMSGPRAENGKRLGGSPDRADSVFCA